MWITRWTGGECWGNYTHVCIQARAVVAVWDDGREVNESSRHELWIALWIAVTLSANLESWEIRERTFLCAVITVE